MKLKQLLIFFLLFVSMSAFSFEMREIDKGSNSNGYVIINKIESGTLTKQEIEEYKKKNSIHEKSQQYRKKPMEKQDKLSK